VFLSERNRGGAFRAAFLGAAGSWGSLIRGVALRCSDSTELVNFQVDYKERRGAESAAAIQSRKDPGARAEQIV
jgi:hypothetical protein